jgi:creatinine amidohydrolase/Fe(II)-dependent formamide hydrolase-like protein
MRKSLAILVALFAGALIAVSCREHPESARPGVWKLEELTDAQLASLSRDSSIFFLTFGNLEVHGPHLPLGTDHFQAIGFRDGLVERLRAAYPAYDIVVVPTVPLGEGGVEELAGHWDHTGSFAVRYETLRNVAIDLGAEIARKGFKHIFLVHAHGGFLHCIAFSEATAFVSDRYDVQMVDIASYVFADAFDSPDVMEAHLGPGWIEETGLFHHGGAGETGKILFLRPDLVAGAYRQLPPFVARDLTNVFDVSGREDWQGYWGHPAQGSAGLGEDLMRHLVESGFQFVERVLRGEDLSHLPVYPESFLQFPEARAYFEALREHNARQTAEVEEWLEARSTREP